MRVWGNHHRNGYGSIRGASPTRVLLLYPAFWIKDFVKILISLSQKQLMKLVEVLFKIVLIKTSKSYEQ